MPRHRYRNQTSLRVESLEDRLTPANFNVPWLDPSHLTLSFVPDGTPALSTPSSLFATLDAQMPRGAWQLAILRAAQTWSEVSGVNIGTVPDGGAALGIAGPAQGDPRFGDIRVAALPMAVEMAVATPPDVVFAGTLAGDIDINSQAKFTRDSLFGVALHEVGHALGIPSSRDPSSVMFDKFRGNLTLSPADIASIRSLYGPRTADLNEGRLGNGSIATATPVGYSGSFDGSTPLALFGDIGSPADVDIFAFRGLNKYSGPMTIRLQTTGISLLSPRLSLLDAKGVVIASAMGTRIDGDTVSVTMPNAKQDGKYFLRVEAAPGATFAVGRYGLAITFDNRLAPTAFSTDAVLRGPYDTLKLDDVIKLFKAPSAINFNDDFGRNDSSKTATILTTAPGYAPNTAFKTLASIATSGDVDFYHIKAPATQGGVPVVLTATVRAVLPNGAMQRIELFDARQVRIPSTILSNGNGSFTVQAAGLLSNTDYYVRVGGGRAGNYQLDIAFGSKAEVLQTFSSGTVTNAGALTSTLYLAETQIFGFTLTANGPAGATVQLDFINDAGRVVFTLAGPGGDTVSGMTGLLSPGKYRVRASVVGTTAPVTFTVRGSGISDPIGPQIQNTATSPQYVDPVDATYFLYPNGTRTIDPFLWLFWATL